MTVLIDVSAYAQEVEAFAGLADEFIEKGSAVQLVAISRELRAGVEAGLPAWTWETTTPIRFGPSTQYDGPNRTFPETILEISFRCRFERPVKVRKKCPVWTLRLCNTHAQLIRHDAALPFHLDYKNPGQWGPQSHFQLSNDLTPLPIPRLVASAFLPTDCADLMLSELHPVEWIQAQHRNNHHASTIRDGQDARSRAYLADVGRQWDANKQSTRLSMLQGYTAQVGALPDFRRRIPAFT